MIKVYSMTAIMDLSFPGQRTATATLYIPHDSVITCQDRVLESPLINKNCKPCVFLLTAMHALITTHSKVDYTTYWGLRLLLFKNSSVGSITSHKNEKNERAER